MHLDRTLPRRPGLVLGAASVALALGAFTPGAAFAQDPAASAAPDTSGPVSITVSADPTGAQPIDVSGTTVQLDGACGQIGTVIVGDPNQPGAPAPQVTVQGIDGSVCTSGGFGVGPDGMGGGPGMITVSGGDLAGAPAWGFGGPGMAGPMVVGTSAGFGGAQGGIVTVSAQPAQKVTVTGVDGSTVSLKTDDGWTRDLDTTNVVITLDGDTLTAADLAVGDEVQVDQVRNANDTYTVTGLEVVLPEVTGTVSSITDTGFTVTEPDGTATVVTIDDATTWPPTVPVAAGAPTGLAALKDGDLVDVRGKTTDGAMTAHSVLVLPGAMVITSVGKSGPGMSGPVVEGQPAVPAQPAPTPEASPAG